MRAHGILPLLTQLALILAGLLLAAATAFAEPPARFENAITYFNLNTEQPSGRESFHGYRTDYTYFLNRRFGLSGGLAQAQGRNADLLFGPEIVLLGAGRVSIKLHARVGASRRLFRVPPAGSATHGWHFASAVGSSVDVYLGKGFAWRVIQPELLLWRQDGSQTDYRFSTGVVLRFGKTR